MLPIAVAATALLARASRESLNVRGAYLHVLTDLAAFVGTAIAGGLILATGWDRFDPIAGLIVAGLMFWGASGLLRESMRIFLEVAPENIQPELVRQAALGEADVVSVHDLHVWTLTDGFPIVSAHVLVTAGADCHAIRERLDRMLAERFGLQHSTLQVEHDRGPVQLGPSFRRRSALPPQRHGQSPSTR